jgi:hypothetical protein
MSRRTVALDFNGVLDEYIGFPKDGIGTEYPPRHNVEAFLIALHRMNYKVVIFTVINTEAVWDWLRKYDLHMHIDEVTNSKPPAMAYIDDRAINFNGNYQDALNALKDFKAHWE